MDKDDLKHRYTYFTHPAMPGAEFAIRQPRWWHKRKCDPVYGVKEGNEVTLLTAEEITFVMENPSIASLQKVLAGELEDEGIPL